MTFANTKTACALVVALAAAATTAQAEFKLGKTPSATSNKPLFNGAPAVTFLKLGCVVNGSPSEFPNDVFVTNRGNTPITSGKQVRIKTNWGLNKVVPLPALAVGKSAFISNVLDGGMPAGTPCTAILLP